MKTLETILKRTENASIDGIFGINACKHSIKETIATNIKYNAHFGVKHYAEDYETLLAQFLDKANKDVFFNENMVRACYELMQECKLWKEIKFYTSCT